MSAYVVKNCSMLPLEWTKMSSTRCTSNQKYHCLQNDYSQLVDGCFQAMWVEAGRCPVYNSGAAKLDTVPCNGDECPTNVYRSNDLYKFSSCFPRPSLREDIMNITLLPNSTVGDMIDRNNKVIIGPIVGGILVSLICLFVSLLLYRFWKKSKKRENKDDPERLDLLISHKSTHPDFRTVSDKMHPLDCYASIIESLKINGLISIVSNWDFARSHMISKMMEEFTDGLESEHLIISTSHISEYESISNMKGSKLLHFKDCFHEWHNVDHVQKIKDIICDIERDCIKKEENASGKEKTKERQNYVIFTITSTAWQKFQHIFKDCPVFSEERRHLVQLTERENDKFVDLCLSSCEFSTSNIHHFKYSIKKQLRDAQECYMACQMFMFSKTSESFLENPLNNIADDLQCMMYSKDVSEQQKFILFATLMMKGGYMPINDANCGFFKISDFKMKLRTAIFIKLKHKYPPLPIELYIEAGKDGNTYQITHEEVERILFWTIAKDNLDVLIEHCNEKLLIKCVRPCAKRDDNDHAYAVYVDKKYYAALANKFAQMENETVMSHALYADEEFRALTGDKFIELKVKQQD